MVRFSRSVNDRAAIASFLGSRRGIAENGFLFPMFWRFYYHWIDRSLKRPVRLDEQRASLEDGEWNQFVGDLGETLAVRFLKREGLKPLYRNYRAPKGGEVDVVCRDGEQLIFVEVKTRRSLDFGRPVSAVDRSKQVLITKGALSWLRELNHPDLRFRFDVVEVLLEEGAPPRIEHLRNVFQMPEAYRY